MLLIDRILMLKNNSDGQMQKRGYPCTLRTKRLPRDNLFSFRTSLFINNLYLCTRELTPKASFARSWSGCKEGALHFEMRRRRFGT